MNQTKIYQGQLQDARDRKRKAWRKVKNIRAQIKDEPLGGRRQMLELELLKARDRHMEYLAIEREAKEKLRELEA